MNGVKKPPYGFAEDGGTMYVRLPGNANPNGKSIKLTDSVSQSIVTIRNSPYVILDGFKIAGAGRTWAVNVDNGSHHVTLRNLNVTHSRYGAVLPNNSIFEWSEFSYPNFRNFVDDLFTLNGVASNGPIFDLVKRYYSSGGNAFLEGGLATSGSTPTSNQEFRYNYIHEVFDGEKLGVFNDTVTHHNVYNYNYDDHIEFEGWRSNHTARNLRAHDNLFLNSAATMLSHQVSGGSIQGPHYVYRNVIYITDSRHSHPWTVIKNRKMGNGQVYYYHNVIKNNAGENQGWGNTNWLYWDESVGTPGNLTFRNNIFLFDVLSPGRGGAPVPSFGNNVLAGSSNIGKLTAGGGRYVGNESSVRFTSANSLNFGLQSSSPAINAGTTLPGNWPDSHKSAINGAPDAGAFEYGENPGNNWPRPRSTAYTIEKPDRWK